MPHLEPIPLQQGSARSDGQVAHDPFPGVGQALFDGLGLELFLRSAWMDSVFHTILYFFRNALSRSLCNLTRFSRLAGNTSTAIRFCGPASLGRTERI